MSFADILGSLGVSLILFAYFLNLFDKIQPEQVIYKWMNLLGALLACASSYIIHSVPFMILEGTWALVSSWALVMGTKKR